MFSVFENTKITIYGYPVQLKLLALSSNTVPLFALELNIQTCYVSVYAFLLFKIAIQGGAY